MGEKQKEEEKEEEVVPNLAVNSRGGGEKRRREGEKEEKQTRLGKTGKKTEEKHTLRGRRRRVSTMSSKCVAFSPSLGLFHRSRILPAAADTNLKLGKEGRGE